MLSDLISYAETFSMRRIITCCLLMTGECWFSVHSEPYLPFLTSDLNQFKWLEKPLVQHTS